MCVLFWLGHNLSKPYSIFRWFCYLFFFLFLLLRVVFFGWISVKKFQVTLDLFRDRCKNLSGRWAINFYRWFCIPGASANGSWCPVFTWLQVPRIDITSQQELNMSKLIRIRVMVHGWCFWQNHFRWGWMFRRPWPVNLLTIWAVASSVTTWFFFCSLHFFFFGWV